MVHFIRAFWLHTKEIHDCRIRKTAPKLGGVPTFNVNSVDWDELYRGEADYAPGEPGWNIGEMQPEIAAIHHQGRLKSPILDSGCGVGVVALTLAGYGYDVIGLDLSANAVDKARTAARRLGLTALFDVADLSADSGYEDHFNTVIDGLVFHSIPLEARDGYIRSTARALKPGGRFFTLVFATEAFPPDATFGPRPFTEKQLRDTIGKHLVVDEVRAARAWINAPRTLPEGFEYRNVTIGSDGRAQLPAWLASAHRE
ncbi:SAM-dependent methyltransferase [Mycobacteroides chelonae]|nr:SAM-dependent methyltransferase [Mycobacteroides chelonae]